MDIVLHIQINHLLMSHIQHTCVHSHRSELLNEVLERGTPFAAWDSSMVLAWLEVWVGVPIWYIGAIRNCVHSGAMLSVSGLSLFLLLACVVLIFR